MQNNHRKESISAVTHLKISVGGESEEHSR
jgi:hypothetical protein